MVRAAILAVGLLLAAGCDAADAGGDPGTAPADTAASDTAPVDTGMDAGPQDTGPIGEFALGVNVTGKNTPEFFTELAPGDDLNIEFGPQGLWMVVLAFRTRDLWDPKANLTMTGSCWIGDQNRGELGLIKQRLVGGGDGWWYYYNFFLVVDEIGAAGNDAQIKLTVRDDAGHEHSVDQTVHLIGGP